jgi:hypothetical protein
MCVTVADMIARKAVAGAVVGAALLFSHSASATPRWVDRLLTLPGPVAGTIDLDGSIAWANENVAPCGNCGFVGSGLNVEGVLGIANRVDIGLRVGFRGFKDNLGINEGVVTNADAYARPFDQLAFYGADPGVYGGAEVANPELRVRVRILHIHHLFELGVEGRGLFPFANGTVFTQIIGVPMALHLGRHVRFDFGGYTGFTFYGQPRGALFTLYAPAAFWFQVHDRVWLGPELGFRWYSQDVYGGGRDNWDFMLGFGLGVSCTRWLDFKLQAYSPRVNDGARYFGAGAGVQFYFN